MGVLFFSSFRATAGSLPFEPQTHFTLRNLINVFSSPSTWRLLLNSSWYAIGSTALGLSLAVTFAWFLERTNIPYRRLLFVLILTPMAIPEVILGMSWTLLANPTNGLFNIILRELFGLQGKGPLDIYTIPGMILVTALRFAPMMYMMISGVFSRVDPSLEEASKTSGAGPWATFRHISMPLLAPAILAAIVYYLILAIESFEIAGVLGLSRRIFVLSTAIYFYIHPPIGLPDYGFASAYGVLLLIIATALLFAYLRRIRQTGRFATVTGRGYRPRLIELGRWRWVPVIGIMVYFLFAVGAPFLTIVWTSLLPVFAGYTIAELSLLNLGAYKTLLGMDSLLPAVLNTILIALSSSVIAMVLATMACWISIRWQGRFTKVAEHLSFLILGVPGVVLSLSAIFIYAALPLPIYGTIWIIMIVIATRSLPFATRLMTAAFLQIHQELEEAAATSGANLWHTLKGVVLPLLWPSFMRGFLWVFVRAISEATMALMLYTTANQTIAVIIWFLWMEDANYPVACAIAVPLVVLSGILAYFVSKEAMLTGEGA
jgi:iron(III) transport system permease protein